MKDLNIDILLSTFNGEHFLREQIASIQRQSHSNWRLLIRDDGSYDGTTRVVQEFAATDERILILPVGSHMGPVGSYSLLLQASNADYVMLCDQDDIWYPDKISLTLAKMISVEGQSEDGTPVLIHTDLKVVDRHGVVMADSFWQFQHLDPGIAASLNRLVVQNVATGCTMMINSPLLSLVVPVPGAAVMYDWWIALVACALGRVAHLEDKTVGYRQHGANHLGAVKMSLSPGTLIHRIWQEVSEGRARRSLCDALDQADAFLESYGDRLDHDKKSLLESFTSLGREGFIKRRQMILENRFFKCGFPRNVGMFLRI